MSDFMDFIGKDCFHLILQFCPLKTIIKMARTNKGHYQAIHTPIAFKYVPTITITSNKIEPFVASRISSYLPELENLIREWSPTYESLINQAIRHMIHVRRLNPNLISHPLIDRKAFYFFLSQLRHLTYLNFFNQCENND